MKDESSIFDAEPENLDRLFSQILGGPDDHEDSGIAATADGVFVQLGRQIGRYALLSILGEGGMGIVYLAEQKHPIIRQVALKVIKPGMDSKRVIARLKRNVRLWLSWTSRISLVSMTPARQRPDGRIL